MKTSMKNLTVVFFIVLALGFSPVAFATEGQGHHPGGHHHHDGDGMPPVVVVPGHFSIDVKVDMTLTSGIAVLQDGTNTQINAIVNIGDADLVGVSADATALLNIANLGYTCNGCGMSGLVVQSTQESAVNATINAGSLSANGNMVEGGTVLRALAGGNFFNVTVSGLTGTGAP